MFNPTVNSQTMSPDLLSSAFNKVTITAFEHLYLFTSYDLELLSFFDILYPIEYAQSRASTSTNFAAAFPGSPAVQLQKGSQPNLVSASGAQHENWGESNMADSSSHTETSTDVDPDDKNPKVICL